MQIESGLENKPQSFHHFPHKTCEARLQGASLKVLKHSPV